MRKPKSNSKIKRPYGTHYFHKASDPRSFVSSNGAAASEQGAIRGAVVRIFMGQYEKAVIYDRATGVALYNIKRQGRGITTSFGSGVPFKTWEA